MGRASLGCQLPASYPTRGCTDARSSFPSGRDCAVAAETVEFPLLELALSSSISSVVKCAFSSICLGPGAPPAPLRSRTHTHPCPTPTPSGSSSRLSIGAPASPSGGAPPLTH